MPLSPGPKSLCLLILASLCAVARAQDAKPTVTLTWFGQDCFLLESPRHTHVLIDPLAASSGFPAIPDSVTADAVVESDADAENTGPYRSREHAAVLRGVSADGARWIPLRIRIGDVSILDVASSRHPDGAAREPDAIFVFETAGLRVVHLGDLDRLLTPEQVKKIGRVDVLLVPVGGKATLDPRLAHQVIGQLKPRYYIIPMHYGTDVAGTSDLQPFEAFRRLEDPVTPNVEITHLHSYQVALYNLPKEPKILELEYR